MTLIDTLNWFLRVAGIVLPTLGLLLLILGLRGRRVGDAPYCRNCRYNLTGVPSMRCPECGHDLAAPKATRIGQRQHRNAPLWIGALLLLVALAGWSGEAYRRVNNIDLYRYYPYSLLLDEMKQGGRASLNEIQRRYEAGDLADEQIRQYVALLLDLHAAPDRTGLMPGLELLRQMMLNRDVTAEEAKRYYEQIPRMNWRIRKRIQAGNPLPFGISYTPLGHNDPFRFPPRLTSEVVELNGQVLQASELSPKLDSSRPGGATFYYGHGLHHPILWPYYTIAAAADLPPGQHELKFEAHLVLDTYQAPRVPFTISFRETFEVLPPDEPMIRLIDRPELKDDLLKLIQVGINYHVYADQKNRCEVEIIIGDRWSGKTLPINVAFTAWATYAAEEVAVATVACSKGQTHRSWRTTRITPPAGDTVKITLRPSPEAAARTFDQYEIWNGELVYDNVEVKETRPRR